jgi:cytochrome bd-type quinol oxidase subunit 1
MIYGMAFCLGICAFKFLKIGHQVEEKTSLAVACVFTSDSVVGETPTTAKEI